MGNIYLKMCKMKHSLLSVNVFHVLTYVCSDNFLFGFGCWEIAAHSVGHIFSLYFDYL